MRAKFVIAQNQDVRLMQKITPFQRESFHLTSLEQRARGATWPKVNFLFYCFTVIFSLPFSPPPPFPPSLPSPLPLLPQYWAVPPLPIAQWGFLQPIVIDLQKCFVPPTLIHNLKSFQWAIVWIVWVWLSAVSVSEPKKTFIHLPPPPYHPNFNWKLLGGRGMHIANNPGFTAAACALTSSNHLRDFSFLLVPSGEHSFAENSSL